MKSVREAIEFYLHHVKKNKLLMFANIWISIVVIMSFFPSLVAPYDPNRVFPGKAGVAPSLDFLMGTDHIGRDIFSQIVWGTRTSLMIACGALVIELLIALPAGLFAGYFGGYIDQLLMRISDAVLTIPTIVLLIVAVTLLRAQSLLSIVLVMGFINWPWLAKIIRGESLRVREEDFVTAAKAMGFSDMYIIFKHILPNITSPIIVVLTFDAAWFILYEATISFIGLGNPTIPSWGRLLYIGRGFLSSYPWISIFPGVFIFLTVLSLNIIGDTLSDLLAIKV